MTRDDDGGLSELLNAIRHASPAESAKLASVLVDRFQSRRGQFGGALAVGETQAGASRYGEALLSHLVEAVEAREPFFRGHSRRVALVSTTIARICNLQENEAARLHIAGFFHDIGTTHPIFAGLLSRPGRLSISEWEVMKTHPKIGADLVAMVPSLRELVPLIAYHHENWDGTGYPHGFVGEEIPIGSRIIQVAETFDALLTHRPYRDPVSTESARSELLKFTGRQFDPSVVEYVVEEEAWDALVRVHQAAVKAGPSGGATDTVSNSFDAA